MIEFIFTLDYEIYGNGTGSLRDLVYEPTEQLRSIFRKWNARFVNFVEVAEFERIDQEGADPAIDRIKEQVKRLRQEGFEIGLHLHPQWYNARFEHQQWKLDYLEYNLCQLHQDRICQIVDRSLAYLQHVLDERHFTPLSFRAGNWLFQPTQPTASVLADRGVRIDSSVFKGGLQRYHHLDYRRALKNGYYWRFSRDASEPDVTGSMVEIPIYTEMVRPWKMPTSKRFGFSSNLGIAGHSNRQKLDRALDFLRFRYPLKLDFCRMTLEELTSMLDRLIWEDRQMPAVYKPIVAIGHTKDLTDVQTVEAFLSYLHTNEIAVSTFESIYSRLKETEREVCAIPA